MLKLENIFSYYGVIRALENINIQVEYGEIVTLIGANGAGKTSVLMTICGCPHAKEGSIYFENQEITNKDTHLIMRNGIAISPEGRRIFKDLTVYENLIMGGFFLNQTEIRTTIENIYDLFPKLKERSAQYAGLMSGGEQQMLAIGRALMSKPRLLLLDEPTLGLAPLIINQIFEIIQMIRKQGITILLVEQNANKALQIADRGYVLENGSIVLKDTGSNLLIDENVKKAYLGI
ncbi:MAG: ABC transporter ATP-binding protein [Bordetella sp.]|nr:MAG: ABC transporter ATP-binding protein [Bordetella sp.]